MIGNGSTLGKAGEERPSEDAAELRLAQLDPASHAEHKLTVEDPARPENSLIIRIPSTANGDSTDASKACITSLEGEKDKLPASIQLPVLPAEAPTINTLDKELQQKLWRKKYEFTAADR